MIRSLLLAAGLLLAFRAPACDDVPPFEDVTARIVATIRAPEPDPDALDGLLDTLARSAACLDAPVDSGTWVPVLLDLTLARFQLGAAWQSPRVAAAWARPDLPLRVGPSLTALRDWTPPPEEDVAPLPAGRSVWLDGRARTTLPRLDGLHLVQGSRCDVWSSALVEGDAATALRDRWLGPCPAPPWSRLHTGLVAGGAAGVVAGAAAVIVTTALAAGTDGWPPTVARQPLTPGTRTAIQGAHVAGWSILSGATASLVAGAVLRARAVRRGRARP